MTTVKLDSKLSANASAALDELTSKLYAKPGMRIVGVVELRHVERTEPAPDEDKEPTVKLGIKHLEIARGEQEEHIRKALRALYLTRTASGTLTDDSEVELSDETLRLTSGMLAAVEAARLRVAISQWSEYARKVGYMDLTVAGLKDEVRTIQRGLATALDWRESDGIE